jgi:excisionase family DNA binding protein
MGCRAGGVSADSTRGRVLKYYLHELLTSKEAAGQLGLSHDRVYRLLERRQLGGIRVANRWLITPADLAEFRERRYGEVRALCDAALGQPSLRLTEKQRRICEVLRHGVSISKAARDLGLPRPGIYAQLGLIRKKLSRLNPAFAPSQSSTSSPTSSR